MLTFGMFRRFNWRLESFGFTEIDKMGEEKEENGSKGREGEREREIV